MDFKVVRFQDVPNELWDKWVFSIKESSYLHSSKFLNFLHKMVMPENCLTFALIQNEDNPIALCPFGLSKNSVNGMDFYEASWHGAPLGAPAFRDEVKPNLRMKMQREVFEYYGQLLKKHGAKRCYLRSHPVTLNVLSNSRMPTMLQLSILQEGYECHPQNTLMIDLANSEETLLFHLSKYQKKHIRKSNKDGLLFVEYDGQNSGLEKIFYKYQDAHIKSAGHMTRPQSTFDLMLELIKDGFASMFAVFAEGIPISFLYCGEFNDFAFGWSQVNLDEFEKRYSPRHFLEWSAIMAYKRRKFRYYEVGTVWFGPQLYKIPSKKELSISEFKRRYGGVFMPEIFFEKIYDKELWSHIHQHRYDQFLQSEYFNEFSEIKNEEAV